MSNPQSVRTCPQCGYELIPGRVVRDRSDRLLSRDWVCLKDSYVETQYGDLDGGKRLPPIPLDSDVAKFWLHFRFKIRPRLSQLPHRIDESFSIAVEESKRQLKEHDPDVKILISLYNKVRCDKIIKRLR